MDADVTYPALFCELKPVGGVSVATRQTTFMFGLYFFDLLDTAVNSQQNEYEIKSDMASIAQDFYAMLKYTDYQSDWDISDSITMTIRDYELKDLCAGVSLDIEIGVRFDANRCQVPAENVTFEADQNGNFIYVQLPSTTIYVTATSFTKVLTISALVGKTIALILRGGFGVDGVSTDVAGEPTGSIVYFGSGGGTLRVNDEFIFNTTEILTIQYY